MTTTTTTTNIEEDRVWEIHRRNRKAALDAAYTRIRNNLTYEVTADMVLTALQAAA